MEVLAGLSFFLVSPLSWEVLFDVPFIDRTSEIQNGAVTISNTRAAKNPRNTANSPALIPAEMRIVRIIVHIVSAVLLRI